MDFIQGLIDIGSMSGSEWHIVTNDGSFDILNNCSGEVLFTILNDGSIGTGPNYSANFINAYSNITVGTNFGSYTTTSNYVLSTSNNLIYKANENDANISNYVLSTSNILSNRLYILDQLTSNVVNNSISTLNIEVNANDANVSNYVLSTSNLIASRITNLTTDMITQTANATRKFIENNSYNNNLEVNGNLTINSNLIVLGDSTQLDTIVYTTERLEIVNGNNTTTALMVQQNTASRDIFVASNISTNVFKIANNGDVLMNGTLTATNIAGAGASVTALNMANVSSGTLAVARGGTGASTFTAGQVLIGNTTTALLQTANLTWDVANNRLGVRTATPATSLHVVGEIVATNNITSYYSDERLKTKIADITEPLEIVGKLNGFYYIPNALARLNGITHNTQEVGLSAQDVQSVLPEIVKLAPFDLATDDEGNKISKSGENYLTISYERLAPVFVEAIKELKKEVAMLKQRVADLENKKE
jgi:polyhydroxyalkanoate synthesis regulator phasin